MTHVITARGARHERVAVMCMVRQVVMMVKYYC